MRSQVQETPAFDQHTRGHRQTFFIDSAADLHFCGVKKEREANAHYNRLVFAIFIKCQAFKSTHYLIGFRVAAKTPFVLLIHLLDLLASAEWLLVSHGRTVCCVDSSQASFPKPSGLTRGRHGESTLPRTLTAYAASPQSWSSSVTTPRRTISTCSRHTASTGPRGRRRRYSCPSSASSTLAGRWSTYFSSYPASSSRTNRSGRYTPATWKRALRRCRLRPSAGPSACLGPASCLPSSSRS